MKSLLAAAAASAFSFWAIVLQNFFRVDTISANLLRETVTAWASRTLAAMHVAIAILTIAVASANGYPLAGVGCELDQNVAVRIPETSVNDDPVQLFASYLPVKCIPATPVVAAIEKRICFPGWVSI